MTRPLGAFVVVEVVPGEELFDGQVLGGLQEQLPKATSCSRFVACFHRAELLLRMPEDDAHFVALRGHGVVCKDAPRSGA